MQLNKTIVYAFNKTIIDEHNLFLEHIYHKYGKLGNFTIHDLYDKYHINNILIKHHLQTTNKPNPKPINNNNTISNTINHNKCMARCWGGKDFVKFDSKSNKWFYGYQCNNKKYNNSQYCKIHLKQTNLTHGRIDQQPPHPHYNKYK